MGLRGVTRHLIVCFTLSTREDIQIESNDFSLEFTLDTLDGASNYLSLMYTIIYDVGVSIYIGICLN